MSMALRRSRARAGTGPALNRQQFRGDPGLFGDIFRTATSFIRDPIGTAIDIGTKILGGGGGDPPPKTMAQSQAEAVATNGTITSFAQDKFPGEIGPFDLDIFGAGQPGASLSFGANGASTATAAPANGKCQSGFHLNKATYFLKSGQRILKGTVCVKNRRRNALNDRAASNAIKRLEGARKAIKNIQRVSIRCGKCPGKCICK